MHEVRTGMQHRHKRVQGLEEREPALIDLPIALPSVPLLSPILDPILTPIIAGKAQATTTPSHATTPTTPTQTPAPPSSPASTTPSNPAPAPSSSPNGSGGDPGNNGNGNGNGNGASSSNGSGGSNPKPGTTAPASPLTSSPTGSSGSSDPSDPSPAGGSDAVGDHSTSSVSSPEGFTDASSTGSLVPIINANGGQAFVTKTGGDGAEETGSGVSVTGTAGRGVSAGLSGTATGLHPGVTTGTSNADPSSPTGNVDATSASHGLSTGIIVAISVIAALLALMLLLCCVRRRAVASRMRRRKQWFAGGRSGGEKDYSDKDGLAAGTQSNRSSFATHFDRGQMLYSPNPFDVPVTVTIQSTTQVWPSEMSGSITVVPAAAHTVESAASPTFRSAADRSSIHSTSSTGSNCPPSQDAQFLVAPPPLAATEGSPYGLDCPSPFSVRPFSPSETFAFPKPPKDDAQSRASVLATGSVKSSVLGSAFYTAEDAHSPTAENENPFADFTEVVVRPPSTATDNSVPHHFAPVETIQRPFVPSMDDELAVNPGDEVRILKRFDDGWAVAEKVGTSTQGLIPIDCMRAVEEELPAFLAKKRISSYRARSSMRASVLSGGSSVGAAM